MTRSFVKSMSSWLKTAFSAKVFKQKPEAYNRKVKTPPDYYRSKARQQSHGEQLDLTPEMRAEYLAAGRAASRLAPKAQKAKKR